MSVLIILFDDSIKKNTEEMERGPPEFRVHSFDQSFYLLIISSSNNTAGEENNISKFSCLLTGGRSFISVY